MLIAVCSSIAVQAREVRRQGHAREALVFTPQLEPMPSDLCIMIDNQLRCDFHTLS